MTIEKYPGSIHLSRTLTLVFFRIFYILHDYKFDEYGMKILEFSNKLESLDTPRSERLEMYDMFLSFVRLNGVAITAMYTQNAWDDIQVEEGNELHEALKHTLEARTYKDKDIINQIVTQIACALEMYPRTVIDV